MPKINLSRFSNLYNVTLDTAIKLVALSAGFVVENVEGAYFISTRANAGKGIANGLTQVRTLKVQYSETSKLVDILSSHLSRFGKITPMPERRLLVVEGVPKFLNKIERLLAIIDREPEQILIDAKLLEVTLSENESFGPDWERAFKSGDGGGSFGISGLAAVGAPGLFFDLVNSDISLQLTALGEKGRIRTLSSPKLLVTEHQEA